MKMMTSIVIPTPPLVSAPMLEYARFVCSNLLPYPDVDQITNALIQCLFCVCFIGIDEDDEDDEDDD